jgi:hypothetical protein
MSMDLTGVVVSILPEQTGTSKKGTWRKQEFVLEIPGTFPKKVCIAMWGEKIDQWAVRQGDTVTASIDVESREYNGRWYTEVKAWKVTKGQGAAAPAYSAPVPQEPYPTASFDNDPGDLPF